MSMTDRETDDTDNRGGFSPPPGKRRDGKPVSCLEKIKVLNENLEEIRGLAQDALEAAVLMGCDEAQIRAVFTAMLEDLKNPYRKPKWVSLGSLSRRRRWRCCPWSWLGPLPPSPWT